MAGLNDYQNHPGHNLNYEDYIDYSSPYLRGTLLPPPSQASTCQFPVPLTDEDMVFKYIENGVTLVSLIAENLLCHPFVVLRRQCQVHSNSHRSHIIPITLIPVMCQLHQHQGITTLWKGLGSTLLIRGLSLGVEDLLSKITPWPKEIRSSYSPKQMFQHALLKCLSFAVITPFYSASLVETVQSDIASEKPGILDVFREGFMRMLTWGSGSKGRMLPIWALVLPTVTLGIIRYFFSIVVQGTTSRFMHVRHNAKIQCTGALPRNLPNTSAMQEIELNANLVSIIVTDVVFYPLETILHRLHLQGTRTIIDNLDTGRSVIAILTNYRGAGDCYESCVQNEGVLGLYKGFGALILQFAAHVALIRITRYLLTEITLLYHKPAKKDNNSPPAISNMTTPGQAYLLP